MKAWLRDDATTTTCGVQVALEGDGMGVPVGLSDDPAYTAVEVNPTLTVRVRTIEGLDPDGNPMFTWVDVVTAISTLWEDRKEVDDRTGQTLIVARVTIPYVGETVVTETASVVDSLGMMWRVNAVSKYPERLELKLTRLESS